MAPHRDRVALLRQSCGFCSSSFFMVRLAVRMDDAMMSDLLRAVDRLTPGLTGARLCRLLEARGDHAAQSDGIVIKPAAVADVQPAWSGEAWDDERGTSPGGEPAMSAQEAEIVRRICEWCEVAGRTGAMGIAVVERSRRHQLGPASVQAASEHQARSARFGERDAAHRVCLVTRSQIA